MQRSSGEKNLKHGICFLRGVKSRQALPIAAFHMHPLLRLFPWPLLITAFFLPFPKKSNASFNTSPAVRTGAERFAEYLPLISGKKIALVVNHTSLVGKTHLADTLLSLGVPVVKIFAPEHGFRGMADAGEKVDHGRDDKTGVAIVSLYGNNYKPSAAQLKEIEAVVYDIQDVGVRFYTYISTLHYVMEACAENNLPLIVLDRPNPNGFYADGPVLKPEFKSFVGLDPVPVVYGLTAGEYAHMLNGERWLANGVQCRLKVIACEGYDHKTMYELPVNPSPNLRSMNAIYLYPSVCLFEGTQVSVGRGTEKPFSLIGFPGFKNGYERFTPQSVAGAKNPPYQGIECTGYDLSGLNTGFFIVRKKLFLQWLMEFYQAYPDPETFFTGYFNTLAGNSELKEQIKNGWSEMEIRRSWEPELSQFKTIRKKYLLYPDFE
jgi:uncharacterized protein YbbC (DUF1343 family)